tara:strand:- start:46 stop:429 length:384 start_codon:yes stop_codon:yes gene_type:complete
MNNSATLYTEIYYDSIKKEYFNIITINKIIEGPLKSYIKNIVLQKPSITNFNVNKSYCSLTINSSILNNSNFNNNNFLIIEDIPDLYEFLINNNYIIVNTLNEILNYSSIKLESSKKLLFLIKYTPC